MEENWLPKGQHWGLRITHDKGEDAGTFLNSPKWKIVWHTTEGNDFGAMKRVLKEKRALPHFLVAVGGVSVCQFIPLNHAGRALEHVGGVETNRARTIQIEICGFAKDSAHWTDSKYKHLAALAVLIEHRVNVAREAHLPFTDTPHRIPDSEWYGWRGHVGHQHVPNQPSGHWDPGSFNIHKLFTYMGEAEKKYGGK